MKIIKILSVYILLIPIMFAAAIAATPFFILTLSFGGKNDLDLFHARIGENMKNCVQRFIEGDK